MKKLPAKVIRLHVATRPAPAWLQGDGLCLRVGVLVVPGASRTRIMGVHDGMLKLQLAAPPSNGLANAALVRFVATRLHVARAQVTLVAGGSNRRKRLQVVGVSYQAALLALSPSPA